MCFVSLVSPLNIFCTFDKAMPKLSFSHKKKSYGLGCICHVCGNSFWMKGNIRKHWQKEHKFFFGTRLEISTFKTYFTESKTLACSQFFQ